MPEGRARTGENRAMSSDRRRVEQKLSFVRPRKQQRLATIAIEQGVIAVRLARTALLVIDMQNDFLPADGWVPRSGSDPTAARALPPRLSRRTPRRPTSG